MRRIVLAAVLLSLAACTSLPPRPVEPVRMVAPEPEPILTPAQTARVFTEVVARVEPVAERMCRERTRNVPCDFQLVVDARPQAPPNAFQTLDAAGRPVIGLTLSLLDDARNADELAFVLGHETSHHILGHIPRQREQSLRGAVLAGVLAQMGGADAATMQSMQRMGASLGARSYSRDYELEADSLGTAITLAAGYDPVRGAQFFTRLPDPGDRFMGSHPPNRQRIAVVRRVAESMGFYSPVGG